ncbi:MAG: hypothetical protein ACTS4V_00175 [Candidatus Hodgkinia cicadicola]
MLPNFYKLKVISNNGTFIFMQMREWRILQETNGCLLITGTADNDG